MSGLVVPYITAHSEERVSLNLGFTRDAETTDGRRLSYLDEPVPEDWDFGALWARQENHRRGDPEFDQVHTGRQRECLLDLLCQVCAGSAVDADTGRAWWVLPVAARTASPQGSKAPTCRGCIPAAVRHCPTLRRQAFIYSSAEVVPSAVLGYVFALRAGRTICIERNTVISLEAFRALEYTLARALLVQIHDLRVERAA